MIAIINTGENKELTGKHRYRVQINRCLITTFTHIREHGLAECLRKAADAVEKEEKEHDETYPSENKAREEPNSYIVTHITDEEKTNEYDPDLLTQGAFCDKIVLAMMRSR